MPLPEFLEKFRQPQQAQTDSAELPDILPPWPGNLRPWWDEAPDSPSDTEVTIFVGWAEIAANSIADLSDPDQQQAALEEFERRCAVFDRLPEKIKREALETNSPRELPDPEVAWRARQHRKFQRLFRKPWKTPPKTWDTLPEVSAIVYVVPDPESDGWVAHRWGQPLPVGRGIEQVAAVMDLHEKERR